MILGMSISTFTWAHVVLSLVGMFSGAVVLFGMLRSAWLNGWTLLFLITTFLTSVTGFFFPFGAFGASHIVGVISLMLLAAAISAKYSFQLAGAWRWIYVIGAVTALYLNVFVGIVQAFRKWPFLISLAPTQSEPPFIAAQSLVLAAFVALGVVSARRFHPETKAAALNPSL